MRLIARPLSSYPVTETTERRRGTFKAAVGRTLDELNDELHRIGVMDAVLELDIVERDLRHDDGLRADARPKTPRVVLSFTHPEAGPLRYPCDTYAAWEDNVRAIRLALEALRAVDRYGITRRGEQYTGWRALPATTSVTLNAEAAARLIVANDPQTAGLDSQRATAEVHAILRDRAAAKAAIRRAMVASHPDAVGPERAEMFKAVGQARQVLDAHHGGGLA